MFSMLSLYVSVRQYPIGVKTHKKVTEKENHGEKTSGK